MKRAVFFFLRGLWSILAPGFFTRKPPSDLIRRMAAQRSLF